MRTLLLTGWTCHRYQDVRDAVDAAALVGVTPHVVVVESEWLFSLILADEHYFVKHATNMFAEMDKAHALVAIRGQTHDDLLDKKIAHARKRGLIVAVWQV